MTWLAIPAPPLPPDVGDPNSLVMLSLAKTGPGHSWRLRFLFRPALTKDLPWLAPKGKVGVLVGTGEHEGSVRLVRNGGHILDGVGTGSAHDGVRQAVLQLRPIEPDKCKTQRFGLKDFDWNDGWLEMTLPDWARPCADGATPVEHKAVAAAPPPRPGPSARPAQAPFKPTPPQIKTVATVAPQRPAPTATAPAATRTAAVTPPPAPAAPARPPAASTPAPVAPTAKPKPAALPLPAVGPVRLPPASANGKIYANYAQIKAWCVGWKIHFDGDMKPVNQLRKTLRAPEIVLDETVKSVVEQDAAD